MIPGCVYGLIFRQYRPGKCPDRQLLSRRDGRMLAELSLELLDDRPDLVVISPNDPEAMGLYCQECQELGIPYIYDPSQQIVRLIGR